MKRYYYKGKFMVPVQKTSNIEAANAILKMDDVWFLFLKNVVYEKEILPLPLEENLGIILSCIFSQEKIQRIVDALMRIETYNPFTDNIPLNEISPDTQKIIIKIQDYIKKTKDVYKETKNLIIKFNDNKIPHTEKTLCLLSGENTYFYTDNKEGWLNALSAHEKDTYDFNSEKIFNIKKTKINTIDKIISISKEVE